MKAARVAYRDDICGNAFPIAISSCTHNTPSDYCSEPTALA
jgi:hypothetical protein